MGLSNDRIKEIALTIIAAQLEGDKVSFEELKRIIDSPHSLKFVQDLKLSKKEKKEFFDMLGKYSMDKHFSHAEN